MISTIKKLRDETGAPLMLCKEAAYACDKDFQKSMQFIRDKWEGVPSTPSGERAGRIVSEVHQGRIGVLLDIRCSTDFAAKTDVFKSLCKELALQLIASGEHDFVNQPYIRDEQQKVWQVVQTASAHIGELITIKRLARMEFPKSCV